MLLLILSDSHIPDRALDLPSKFKKLLSVPNKIGQVLLLGNSTRSYQFLKFVNEISNNVVIVRGEFDNAMISTTQNLKEEIPMNTIIKQGDFKIGCCNGYTLVPKSDPLALLTLARQLDVDIMLWGGTHSVEAYTLEGKFFINPGSCTGSYSTDWPIQLDSVQGVKKLIGQSGNCKSGGDAVTESAAPNLGSAKRAEDTRHSPVRTEKEDVKPNDRNDSHIKGQKHDESQKETATTEDEDENSENDEEIDEVDVNGGCIPSFCLLDISGDTCTLYIYTYVNDEVKVDKVVYKKD
ncbi:HFL179Wp [Eremothecium sinecaudum]|uniref:Vacuolar protein sorting-associated protein 29 n=1 Tax=Eremothecium sinecaudum TaxID=45286 RepID=A0A120K2J3_9SACH|nr:HFL179Wp [Eremothecium sinecaudum]AMD21677.1 HFL179Wp [Eremothecium sinecaudum]